MFFSVPYPRVIVKICSRFFDYSTVTAHVYPHLPLPFRLACRPSYVCGIRFCSFAKVNACSAERQTNWTSAVSERAACFKS